MYHLQTKCFFAYELLDNLEKDYPEKLFALLELPKNIIGLNEFERINKITAKKFSISDYRNWINKITHSI